jgi:hypothetical protein
MRFPRFLRLLPVLLLLLAPLPLRAQQLSLEDELYTYVLGIEGKSHDERGDYIKAQLKRVMIPFVTMPFTDIKVHGGDTVRIRGENIIARMGRGPKKIVVGAHYDAVPNSPGANDNGGGVAVLLALGRSLRQQQWNYSVELCFFDQEEAGLIGSRQYVSRFTDRRTHLAMVNMDVVGTGDELYVGPVGGGDDFLLMPIVRNAARTTHAVLNERKEYPDSDHESFAEKQLENISISVVPKGDADKLVRMVRGEIRSQEDMPQVLGVMHTPNDSSREVSPDALKICFGFVKEILLELNQSR